MSSEKILQVDNLTVEIDKRRVIDGVSFCLKKGVTTALVGESGSGKTLTALSILNLLPEAAVRAGGVINYRGKNIFDLGKEEMRETRGARISMVFQESFAALNPVMRVGLQISESLTAHKKLSSKELADNIKRLVNMVRLPQDIIFSYPHELSGGMCQRVNLAMALAAGPEILILDEPTTALDVSIQKEILDLIKDIQKREALAILFITHDFSITNMIADEVSVMKSGAVVEKGSKQEILHNPKHPYTQRLINCIPRLGDKRKRLPV